MTVCWLQHLGACHTTAPLFGSWVPQEASQGAQPGWQAAPTAEGWQWESPLRVCPGAGWGTQGIFGCCQSYTICITSSKLPGLKAVRSVVKLMRGSLKVQKMVWSFRRRPCWCLIGLSGVKQTLAVVQEYEEQCGWAASEAAWALDSSHSSSGHNSRARFFLSNLFLPEEKLFAISLTIWGIW